MNDNEISKAVVIDKLFGKFIGDGMGTLANSISELFNQFIFQEIPQKTCKVTEKLKSIYKKVKKTNHFNCRSVLLLG